MSQELSQLPIWIQVLEYDFKKHTIKARLGSKVEITFRLNPIVESQLLKLIDSGVTPKRIQVFIQDNDISSLIGHEELSVEKELESLDSVEAFKRIRQGLYPKDVAKKYMEKQRDQLRLEIQCSSPRGIVLYSDPELKNEISEIYFGLVQGGESKDLTIYLRNSTSAVLSDIQVNMNDDQVEVLKVSTRIFPNQGGELVLRYTPNEKKKKPLHVQMNIIADEIYADPAHYKEIFK